MIQSSSPMDRAVARPKGLSRRGVALLVALAAAAAAALALLPAALRFWRAEGSVDASTLRIGAVTRGDLRRDVSVQGKIVAALHPTLYAPAAGIAVLRTRAGTVVKAGELLALVESPELESRLAQERSTLLALGSELERQRLAARERQLEARRSIELLDVKRAAAERAMARAERSLAEGLVDRTFHEEAQDALRVATLELEHARAAATLETERLAAEGRDRELQVERQKSVVAEMERQVAELTIEAPFAGMVATVAVRDRDAVAAHQPVLTVVDLTAHEVELAIPEEHAREVEAGTEALVRVQGREHRARVTSVSPEVVESQVRAVAAFTVELPPGIRQNERVAARLVFESREGVLKVPRGGFLESGGGRKAYVVEGEVATLRDIEVGAVSVSEVEIVKGLAEGERIVLSDTSEMRGARSVLLR